MRNEFCKIMPIRCHIMTKKAYGNVYKSPLYSVTIPSKVVKALSLTTDDRVEFHVVETEDMVECDVGFIFSEDSGEYEDDEHVECDEDISPIEEVQDVVKQENTAPHNLSEDDERIQKLIRWAYEHKEKKGE